MFDNLLTCFRAGLHPTAPVLRRRDLHHVRSGDVMGHQLRLLSGIAHEKCVLLVS